MSNPITERLTWTQTAPAPDDRYAAECGPYRFDINRTPDRGYRPRMREIHIEGSPLVDREMDGFSGRHRRLRGGANHVSRAQQ